MGRLSSFGSRRSTDVVLTEGGRKPSFSVLRRGRMASVEELAPEQQRVGEEERDRRERSLERRTVVIKPDPADDCSPPYTKEEARRIRHAKRKAEGGVCYCQEEGKPGVLVPEDDTRTAPGATGAAVTAAAKRVRAWVVRTSSASSSVADDQRKKRDDMIEEGIVFDGPAARKGLLVGQDDDDANPTSPYGVIEWRQGRPPSRESAAVTSGSEADDDSDNEQQDTLSLDHSSNKAEWAGGAAAIRAAISSPDEFFDLLWRKYPLLFTNYPEIQTYLDVPGPADKLERLTDDYMPQLALNADEALDEDEEKSEEEKRERVRAALHDVYRMWVDGALVDWAKSKGWRLEMNVAEWEVKGKDESGNVTTAGVKGEKRKERKDSSQGQQQTPEDSHGLKKRFVFLV
ncbi:hypothetical protein SLS55_008156 [Diplodia seriata]|uniref:Uncharacterized protein n=1 Tax=Diplodia seriata TaxID=420778 RepID=A0ABR3C9R0_9PEZI